MAHIALEGRCFVLSACQYAQQKDFPPDHPIALNASRDPEGVMIGGGSVIYSPAGVPLAGPLKEGEGVLTAELDMDDVIRGKYDLDVVGHYARPDSKPFFLVSMFIKTYITICLQCLVFRLLVNEGSQPKI